MSSSCFGKRTAGLLLFGFLLPQSPGLVHAADEPYPVKPIRFVLPFPPGSGTDIQGRVIAQEMSKAVGQPVIIENKAGANGFIATEQVAKAPPDGYTLLMTSNTHLANKFLFKSLPYDPIKDFKSITLLKKTSPLVLVVAADSELKTLADVTRKVRQSPGKLSYGSGNSSSRVGAELYQQLIDGKMLYVPYKGNGEALTDVAAGRVDIMFADSVSILPLLRGAKLRALVSTGLEKPPQLPNVPTVAEASMPGLDIGTWGMVLAPAQTPEAIAERINGIIRAALRTDSVKQNFLLNNAVVYGNSRAELDQFMSAELKKWGDVIRKAGIPPE